MPHVTHASEALGLSPVALLITDLSASANFVGTLLQLSRLHYRQTAAHSQNGATVTTACMLSLAFLCLNGLHAPSHLCFYVGALKAVFLSSFSGITTSIPQESAACAFITRQTPGSSEQTSHSQNQSNSTTLFSSAGVGRGLNAPTKVFSTAYADCRPPPPPLLPMFLKCSVLWALGCALGF